MIQFKKYFKDLDAILVSSWANIAYITGYPGFSKDERECFLFITKTRQYLITDGRYSEALKKHAPNFEVIEASALGFIAKDHSDILKNLRMKKVGIEENNLTVSEYKSLKKNLKNTKNIDLSKLRIIKNNNELKNIKLACKIGDLAYDFIIGRLKIGITELQVADQLELFVKQKGAEFSFGPIVAFGANSAIPHYLSGKTKLKPNTIVLLDFGVKLNYYCSDMSRTVFVGSAPAKFKRIHATVLQAQAKAIEYINDYYSSSGGTYRLVHPGVEKLALSKTNAFSTNSLLAKNIDKIARDYIVKQGYPEIPHSVGHGIGVEVHEAPHLSPNSKDKIEQGMVFSVEPGIYIPNYGGVRIEDLVLVTNKGAELISHANRNIIEL